MKFLVRAALNALALWLCVQWLSGNHLVGAVGDRNIVIYYFLSGAILAVINFLVRPILVLLSIPFYILTLGLFFMVVNALVLLLASWFTGFLAVGIEVDSFGWAFLGGILVGIVNVVCDAILPSKVQRS